MRYHNSVHESPVQEAERPRERLLRLGVNRLSDRDLVMLIVGSGVRGSGVDKISGILLEVLDRMDHHVIDVEAIHRIPGIGDAKAAQITAALEYARRRYRPATIRIRHPQDVLPVIRHYADRKREHFLSISLNGAHEVIHSRVVSIGTVNRTFVHPREVFSDPLTDRAAAVIVAHNHPSGNVEPSREDADITHRLTESANILGIDLLDHIVFSIDEYYSFLEHDRL